MAAEPTILVKKPDGSTERVPFSQLKQQMQAPAPQAQEEAAPQINEEHVIAPMGTRPPQPAAPVVDESHVIEPMKTRTAPPPPQPVINEEHTIAPIPKKKSEPQPAETEEAVEETHLATTTPVTDVFIDEAIAKETWSKDDHASLLSEAPPEGATAHIAFGQSDDVGPVVSALNFSIAGDLTGRLASLLTSVRKGVRTTAQLSEYAQRDLASGGLGLNDSQAQELVSVASQVLGVPSAPPPVGKRMRPVKPSAPKSQPAPVAPEPPVVHEGGVAALRASIDTIQGTDVRPRLQDITPPTAAVESRSPISSQSTSPIDELSKFTFEEFVRLSDSPEAAGQLLLKKMQHLQKDSYLQYLKGKAAWHKSPLYQQYLDVLADSLEQGTPVEDLLDAGNGLTPEQFQALVQFHQTLDR